MANAFANYSNLIAGLDAANNQKNNALTTFHQTKAGVDSQLSILGDTKVFLSGKSGLEKASKNIVKPLWSKYGSTIKNKLRSRFGLNQNKAPDVPDAPTAPASAAPPTATATAAPPTEAPPDTVLPPDPIPREPVDSSDLQRQFDTPDPADVENDAKEVEGILAKGQRRLADGEDVFREGYDGSGISPLAKGDGDLFKVKLNTEDQVNNDIEDDMLHPEYENVGDNAGQGYALPEDKLSMEEYGTEESGGLTPSETSRVAELRGRNGPSSSTGPAEELEAPQRGGAFNTTASEENAIVRPNLTGDGSGTVDAEGKTLAKKVATKDLEDEGGDLALEEGSLSVLDAVPFLDIAGVIGGAVLAGVEAHHAKKEQEAELDAQTSKVNVNTQIGVSANEALSN